MLAEPVKILAVDDVPENLAALDALLSQEGVHLLQARSGDEALELLLVHDVALALLDVQMPGMDGFELAELMRGTERTRRVPIIFLTAVATDERRRFRGYEAGAVDYLLKPVEPQIVRGKVEIFVELFRQRQELARQRDEHAAALARLTAHSDNSPLAIVELDPQQCIVAWSKGAERLFGWRNAEVAGFRAADVKWLHIDDADAFASLVDELLSGAIHRATRLLRFRTAEGLALDCECYCSALLDGAGRLISVNLQLLNVTDRKRAEETQRLLVGELNHRVKNTLASVQAIARQTLRYSSGPSDFAPTFIGRIHSLAAAHSLLSGATWQGARLKDLVEGQLEIGALGADRFETSGPDLELAPEPALHLALVLHELVTNAHKYGALSVPGGRVALTWGLSDALLSMQWIERGGPAVQVPARKGFGTALIERSLMADGGKAVASYDPEGITWSLTLPHAAASQPLASTAPRETELRRPIDGADVSPLKGAKVLVVEDEPLVALELMTMLEDAGADVVGPAADCPRARSLIAGGGFDAAVLDGNLQGEPVDDLADLLAGLGVPFAFVSGYGRENLPPDHQNVPLLGKPVDSPQLIEALRAMVRAAA